MLQSPMDLQSLIVLGIMLILKQLRRHKREKQNISEMILRKGCGNNIQEYKEVDNYNFTYKSSLISAPSMSSLSFNHSNRRLLDIL